MADNINLPVNNNNNQAPPGAPPLPPQQPAAGGGGNGGGGGGNLLVFPGERSVGLPQNEAIMQALLQIVNLKRPHVHSGNRNKRSVTLWKEVHDMFMDPINGPARRYRPWQADGWKKIRKVAMAYMNLRHGCFENAQLHNEPPSAVERLAYEMFLQKMHADQVHGQTVRRREAIEAARVERLNAAQGGMGLNPPGLGVSAPGGSTITPGQQTGLLSLGQRTISPNNSLGSK